MGTIHAFLKRLDAPSTSIYHNRPEGEPGTTSKSNFLRTHANKHANNKGAPYKALGHQKLQAGHLHLFSSDQVVQTISLKGHATCHPTSPDCDSTKFGNTSHAKALKSHARPPIPAPPACHPLTDRRVLGHRGVASHVQGTGARRPNTAVLAAMPCQRPQHLKGWAIEREGRSTYSVVVQVAWRRCFTQ